jgi:phage gp46-like protein
MDFKIDIKQGRGQMTFEKVDDIRNNIYLSLMVRRGSFFQNPNFGSRLHELFRAKNTDKTAALAKEYCKEALQWLIDTGRATEINISTEKDPNELNRLKILVEATQSDGRKVTFDTYLEVV